MIAAFRPYVFLCAALICALPQMSGGLALLCGLILTLSIGHPFLAQSKKIIKVGMGVVITCLGAGVDIAAVIDAGKNSLSLTIITVAGTIAIGAMIGRLLKTPPAVNVLISIGTAICGGSAIAALSPAIKARDEHTSVALGCVFILNAIALLIFPYIGHMLGMSQLQFGTWVGIAIHDTSSVIGAAAQFGDEALQTATIVKLVRALWIVPCVAVISVIWAHYVEPDSVPTANKKKNVFQIVPWFIYGFVMMSVAFTYAGHLFAPAAQLIDQLQFILTYGGKRAMEVLLFLIGASLTMKTIKSVGLSAMIQAIILWLGVSGGVAIFVLNFL